MSWTTDITSRRLADARDARRTRTIALARKVEAGAIDCKDAIVLAAAQRVIKALGWYKKADPADLAIVREFADLDA